MMPLLVEMQVMAFLGITINEIDFIIITKKEI